LVDLTIAIEIGVVLSAILFMKRMSDISQKRINNIVDTDIIEDYSNIPENISVYEISDPCSLLRPEGIPKLLKKSESKARC
jgi:SulP family sulfate permease